jgi:hypothetical protein
VPIVTSNTLSWATRKARPPPAEELSGAFHSESKAKLAEHASQRIELRIALLR